MTCPLSSTALGAYQTQVETALAEMATDRIIERIWKHDHTVFKPHPTEITNRLGWLHTIARMRPELEALGGFTQSILDDGYTHALLLGMGGSSLAPEVFRKTFGVADGYLDLSVLDSTDPAVVTAHAERLDLSRTLFIVATKSGGTTETLSFFNFFFNRTAETLGSEDAGRHFVAITDPNSKLVDLAERHGFRSTWLNDPNIGGRYSALSYFGLVPAALVGVDLDRLLERADQVAHHCAGGHADVDMASNGAWLGAILGVLYKEGRNKLTLVVSEPIASFADWVEQLIAESTGKEAKGILPVVGEELGPPEVYSGDRLFIQLRLDGDESQDPALDALARAGHPVVRLSVEDRYDLGGQFFLWEMATAIAGHLMEINPFDQPNVEAAKVLARQMVSEYIEGGRLPSSEPAPLQADILQRFLGEARPGSYVSLQAYLEPTSQITAALQALRIRLRDRYSVATTVGYGPRYLHSTGQLHKGGGGHGLFIQFTSDPASDLAIPQEAGVSSSSITFGVLEMAQALGDGRALQQAGRKVIRFHLGRPVESDLRRLAGWIS